MMVPTVTVSPPLASEARTETLINRAGFARGTLLQIVLNPMSATKTLPLLSAATAYAEPNRAVLPGAIGAGMAAGFARDRRDRAGRSDSADRGDVGHEQIAGGVNRHAGGLRETRGIVHRHTEWKIETRRRAHAIRAAVAVAPGRFACQYGHDAIGGNLANRAA